MWRRHGGTSFVYIIDFLVCCGSSSEISEIVFLGLSSSCVSFYLNYKLLNLTANSTVNRRPQHTVIFCAYTMHCWGIFLSHCVSAALCVQFVCSKVGLARVTKTFYNVLYL